MKNTSRQYNESEIGKMLKSEWRCRDYEELLAKALSQDENNPITLSEIRKLNAYFKEINDHPEFKKLPEVYKYIYKSVENLVRQNYPEICRTGRLVICR